MAGVRLIILPSFCTPEVLFQPGMLGPEARGIHKTACVRRSFAFPADTNLSRSFNSIMKCDMDIRKDLCANVVMSGGSTLFPGIADRMWKELTALLPDMKVTPTLVYLFSAVLKHSLFQDRVALTSWGTYSAWIGGSMLGTSSMINGLRLTKQEYDEHGPAIIHRGESRRSIDFPAPCGV